MNTFKNIIATLILMVAIGQTIKMVDEHSPTEYYIIPLVMIVWCIALYLIKDEEL